MLTTFSNWVDSVERYARVYRAYFDKLSGAIEHSANELALSAIDKLLVVHEVAVRMGGQGSRKAHQMPVPFHKLRSLTWRRAMAQMHQRKLCWPRFRRRHHDPRQTELDFKVRR